MLLVSRRLRRSARTSPRIVARQAGRPIPIPTPNEILSLDVITSVGADTEVVDDPDADVFEDAGKSGAPGDVVRTGNCEVVDEVVSTAGNCEMVDGVSTGDWEVVGMAGGVVLGMLQHCMPDISISPPDNGTRVI